jgi:hypothetical protein
VHVLRDFLFVFEAAYADVTYCVYWILHAYGYTLRDKKQKHLALLKRSSKMSLQATVKGTAMADTRDC